MENDRPSIPWVSIVLNRAVVDIDWRFDNLCSCRLLSQNVDSEVK